MMDNEHRFETYWRYIRECARDVVSELSLGNSDSLEALHQHIARVTEILSSNEAFEMINSHSPYEWKDLVDAEMIKSNECNLGNLVLEIANATVFRDTLKLISQMDCYRFITGDKRRKSLILPDGRKVLFKEVWLSETGALDYLPPLKIEDFNGKDLTFYQEGGTPIITLSHPDPSLYWISEKIIPKPLLSIDEFEKIKVKTLLRFEFSRDLIWLTEVQTVFEFNRFYQDQTSPDLPETYYGLENYHYTLYYHENGEVHCHAGFNSIDEFEKSCRFLAKNVAQGI